MKIRIHKGNGVESEGFDQEFNMKLSEINKMLNRNFGYGKVKGRKYFLNSEMDRIQGHEPEFIIFLNN